MIHFTTNPIKLLSILLTIIPLCLFGQNKGGENCNTAYALSLSETSGCQNRIENENTTIAAPATFNPACDNAGINRDLWYSFVAPANGEVALIVNLKTSFRVEGAIFESCPSTGGNNTPIFCNNSGLSGQIVKGLTPGQTYYLQLWSDDFATGTFDLCLAQTENLGSQDECSTPIFLPVTNNNNVCLPQGETYIANNFGATNDPSLPIPSCGSYGQGKDVWYAVVVPPSGQIHAEVGDAGGPNDWVMAAYTGDCENLSELACNDDANNFFPALDLTGLLPGDTILFRIWEYGGDEEGPFTLSFTDPFIYAPNNDNCNSPEALTLVNTDAGCAAYRSCGSSLGAHGSSAPDPGCGVFSGARDLWYSVVLPNGGDLTINLSPNLPGGNNSWSIAAYKGKCNSLTTLGCDAGDALTYPSLSLNGINANDTILIRVSDNGNAQGGNYFICAKTSSSLAQNFENATAYAMTTTNMIQWSYLSDEDDTRFVVEKSKDSKSWQTLGTIEKHSNTNYHLEDNTPYNPMTYYRILAIKTDGSISNSKVLPVYRSEATTIDDRLFPNPVTDILHLNTNLSNFGEEIRTEILGLDGRLLAANTHDIISSTMLSIRVNQLAAQQNYILKVIGNRKSQSYLFHK